MKKNFKVIPLICWTLIIIITALIYCLLVEDLFSSVVKVLSVCFVILAELILCIKFLSKKQSIIMNVQMIFGGSYLLAVFVLSLIYINLTAPQMKWFIAIHATLLLILTILDLTVLNFYGRVENSDKQLAKNQSIMAVCGNLIDIIIAENSEFEFKKDLIDISESIKYCDNSALSGEEDTIIEKLEELKDHIKNYDDKEEIKAKINDIKTLIKVREIYIKQNKRGTF